MPPQMKSFVVEIRATRGETRGDYAEVAIARNARKAKEIVRERAISLGFVACRVLCVYEYASYPA